MPSSMQGAEVGLFSPHGGSARCMMVQFARERSGGPRVTCSGAPLAHPLAVEGFPDGSLLFQALVVSQRNTALPDPLRNHETIRLLCARTCVTQDIHCPALLQ